MDLKILIWGKNIQTNKNKTHKTKSSSDAELAKYLHRMTISLINYLTDQNGKKIYYTHVAHF